MNHRHRPAPPLPLHHDPTHPNAPTPIDMSLRRRATKPATATSSNSEQDTADEAKRHATKPSVAPPERRTAWVPTAFVAVIMTIFGWLLHDIAQSSAPSKPHTASKPVPDPPWWLEEDGDDYFERRYNSALDLYALRDLSHIKPYFTAMCQRYRFDNNLLPTASLIVTTQNEADGMLTLTVHALLARTPPQLLHEIIIVDDNGLGDIRSAVNESEFEELTRLSSKVKIVQNTLREGVARSRMNGARQASGEVLVFLDSHVEMLSATWLQHLLVPIWENPRTLAAQTLDIINDVNWTYGPGSGDLLYGVITDHFWFGYQRSRFGGENDDGAEREAPGRRLPYETPFAAGSLFAIRRDEFFRLGGYDEGMYVWGGENTDFAIKVWACGGRLVMVPCSRVGHMYRIHIDETGRWPPVLPQELTDGLGLGRAKSRFVVHGNPADNFTKITIRNNMRVLERWAETSNARTGYYKVAFGREVPPPEWQMFADEMKDDEFAKFQKRKIEENGCRNFDWFDKHVYYKLLGTHHPWHPDNMGITWVV